MLYIFSGLPGTGKTTLAKAIASHFQAVHLRVDTIEQQLRESGVQEMGPMGYEIAYVIAKDNLKLGLSVVSDSVNPIALSRQAWQEVAMQVGVNFTNIEVICSSREEHQHRIQSRVSDIPNLRLPTWEKVQNREYEEWASNRIIIDTAGRSPSQSRQELVTVLEANTENTTTASTIYQEEGRT